MAKHDERLKRKVVRRYSAGGIGIGALAREFGVARTLAQQWIAEYALHGPAGLQRKGHTQYSAQFKLEALERMQRETLSRTQLRIILGIKDPGAIARWERQHLEGGFPALLPRPKGGRPKITKSTPAQPTPPDCATGARQ